MHPALQYHPLGLLLEDFDFRQLDTLSSQRASCMNVLMTRSTEGHRFSFEGYHPLDPCWFFPSWVRMQVFHSSYMMDFYVLCGPTEFTVSG